ncbi:MAG: glycerate kinase [Bacteroidales bacterium]|nr:glycerate kinase [Bacteroidales bacterium]
MKKVILAFDSFKGCITAQEACQAAALGVHAVWPDAVTSEIPLSDGGEGLVKCIQQILPTQLVNLKVHGPLMQPIEATYALSPDGETAYMEMAAASGLPLVPLEQRDPTKTTTYGVGEMLADAMHRGCKHIIMGIGGSATCDAGRGMIDALKANHCLNTDCKVTVACDVSNPLFGPNGAAYIFAPQKGATPEQVEWLDLQLRAFDKETIKAGIATPDLAEYPGAGAAGGLGFALLAYLKAELHSGINIVLNLVNFEAAIKDADLVITGEGKSDHQTLMGKVPQGVLTMSQKAGVPVWLLSGAIEDASGLLKQHFNLIKSINEGDNRELSELMKPQIAKENMTKTITRLMQNSNV